MKKQKDITTQEKILAVAKDLFGQNGFEGTSTRKICKEAGINISMISYYFGGKQELYKKIIDNITAKIITYALTQIRVDENFDKLDIDKKIKVFLGVVEKMIDFFYSDQISSSELLIILREQVSGKDSLNIMGYQMFNRLLASIMQKTETDKEVIFRTLSVTGQINAARILCQFSYGLMNQSGYGKDDIQMLKQIITRQIRVILEDIKGDLK